MVGRLESAIFCDLREGKDEAMGPYGAFLLGRSLKVVEVGEVGHLPDANQAGISGAILTLQCDNVRHANLSHLAVQEAAPETSDPAWCIVDDRRVGVGRVPNDARTGVHVEAGIVGGRG